MGSNIYQQGDLGCLGKTYKGIAGAAESLTFKTRLDTGCCLEKVLSDLCLLLWHITGSAGGASEAQKGTWLCLASADCLARTQNKGPFWKVSGAFVPQTPRQWPVPRAWGWASTEWFTGQVQEQWPEWVCHGATLGPGP